MLKKLLKTIFWFLIVLWFSWFFVNQTFPSLVYAETATPTATESTEDYVEKNMYKIRDTLDVVTKWIYMITRPLLVIAWNSLDNSLVYWSVFHLDAPLRSFRNIMKNFANFALWFLLLYSIVRSLLKKWWTWWAMKIVKNTLIAGILIQASRFLLSAVIDVSTIATYAVWWIPMTILQNSPQWKQPILWINSSINLSDSNSNLQENLDDVIFYRTYGKEKEFKISSCKTKYVEEKEKNYIIGKQLMFASDTSWEQILLENWYCILWWAPYQINEFPDLQTAISNADYKTKQNTLMKTPQREDREKCWFIIATRWTGTYDKDNCNIQWVWTLAESWSLGTIWWKKRLDWLSPPSWVANLWNLIERSKWFVWPLITIYSSILNFGTLLDDPWSSSDDMTFWVVLKFAIKTITWIMLILPLFALAIVLLARIWFLWLIIAFVPIIILLHFFKEEISLPEMKFLKIPEIIKIIFAPVFVVFGLSLALIFLSTISNSLKKSPLVDTNWVTITWQNSNWDTTKEQLLEWLGLTQEKDNSYSVLGWLSTFSIKWNLFGWVLDDLSYMLINIFWIAIMWMLLFWTIKQNMIWEKIWKKIQDFGQNLAVNVPMVPIAWWVWLKQAFGVWWWEWLAWKTMNQLTNTMENKNIDKLQEAWFLPEDNSSKSPDNNDQVTWQLTPEQANEIIQQIEEKNLTKEDTERKTIIETIRKDAGVETNQAIETWIREPENARLLIAAIEWLNTPAQKTEVTWALEWLLDIKTMQDYKTALSTKTIDDIMKDLKDSKPEAVINIQLDQEITLKDAKKYKIKKVWDKYEYEEITTSPPTTS